MIQPLGFRELLMIALGVFVLVWVALGSLGWTSLLGVTLIAAGIALLTVAVLRWISR